MVVNVDVAVDVDVVSVQMLDSYLSSSVKTVVVGNVEVVAGHSCLGVDVCNEDSVRAVFSLRHLHEDGSILIHFY